MPSAVRRRARQERKQKRRVDTMEGGGRSSGKREMEKFLIGANVRNTMVAQQFQSMMTLMAGVIACYGFWRAFDDAEHDGNYFQAGSDFFSAVVSTLTAWCLRAPGGRATLFKLTGWLAVVHGGSWAALTYGGFVEHFNCVPHGALLYSLVWIFWRLTLHNALKIEHQHIKYKLMEETGGSAAVNNPTYK